MYDICNDQDLETLVHAFYDEVRKNEHLGYIFNDVAKVDWDDHLPKMIGFWSNLLFQTARYRGRPFRQHMSLPIMEGDFDLWYRLFEETVDKFYMGEKTNSIKKLARSIASSFELRMERDGLIKKV